MAIVKKYKSLVISVSNYVPGVYTVELKSLMGNYKYNPGQFLHLAIDPIYDGTDQWPESRCFSIQSNPDKQNIRITYSVKGRFTKCMEKNLKKGSEVWLKLPYGDLFTRQHNKVNTVFIAGGTGITPFLSLFTHKSFKDYIDPRIYLGFKSGSYFIYDREMNLIKFKDHNTRKPGYIALMEDTDGRLDISKIFMENGRSSTYFLSGPVEMVISFREYLLNAGLQESQIITDDWE